MMVNLGGIVPLSTVDWPGRASIVIFLRGCPLRCPYCHNRELQTGESVVAFHALASRIVSQVKGGTGAEKALASPPAQIDLDLAAERAASMPLVDALVLSGGEPLMQLQQSAGILRLARSLHLATGLETSGFYPDRLLDLLEKNLLDKVFLDLKAALQEPDYDRAAGVERVAARVRESLRICMASNVPLEIRTTIFPIAPTTADVVEIAKTLSALLEEFPSNRLERLILAQGRPREGEPWFEPVTVQNLEEMARAVEPLVRVGIMARPDNPQEK